MRIRRTTTQMVNNSRRRAGLTARRSPLLKSNQSSRTGAFSRLDAMNANSVQSSRLARIGFEKLQKSATSLMDQMALLSEKADDGKKDMGETAANVVEDFNDTLKYLQDNSSILNDYYRQSMKEIASSNKTELSEIGITVGKDGTLSLDKEKLEAADGETIKKVLGSSGDLAKRIKAIASRVADNAKVNIKKKLISQFNLHTVVRLPGSVFSPYTSITTNLLFFDNTKPTTETWFYRVDIPSDRKHFSKTKPMELKHFDDCIAWWNDRREIPDGENFKVQKFTAEYLLNEQGCNIDLCGYPHEEEEILDPLDTIREYQERRTTLNAEIDKVLAELEALLPGGVRE